MRVFEETKDPSEVKDYTYNWTNFLDTGETISSQTVAMVSAAGATFGVNTNTQTVSRVWLSGGNHGERIVFTIRIVTTQSRTLEEGFGVEVVDSAIVVDPAPTAETIQARLAEARSQRHLVATGQATVEVMRNGRRVVRRIASMKELNEYIAVLERELAEVTAVAAGGKRRRAISLAWGN